MPDSTEDLKALVDQIAAQRRRARAGVWYVLLVVALGAILTLVTLFLGRDLTGKRRALTETQEQVVRAEQQLSDAHEAAKLVQFGQGQLDAGDPTRAAETFAHAANLDPGNPVALGLQGLAQLKAGQEQAAVQTLEQATRLDSTYVTGQYTLALAYEATGRTADADRVARVVRQQEPQLAPRLEAERLAIRRPEGILRLVPPPTVSPRLRRAVIP